jgi:hypothetical protein
MPNENLAAIKVDHDNKPELISADIEHRASAHLVRMGIGFSHVGEGFPGGMFRHAMPSPQGFFRFRPLLPKFTQLLFGNYVHPCHPFCIVFLIQVFSQNAKKSRAKMILSSKNDSI